MGEAAVLRIDEIPARWARERPAETALIEGGRRFSWRDLEAARQAFAARLRERGVRGGDRVLVMGENGAALVALLFAVPSVDAWVTIVNPRLSAREVDAIRTHSGARLALFLPDGSLDAQGHATRAGALPMDSGDWGTVLATAADAQAHAEPVERDRSLQVAALVYTTGTTGEPKAVMLTHGNLLFVAAASRSLRGLRGDDRVYGVLPLSHVYGLTSVCLGSLMSGARIDLERRYSPAAMQAALARGISVCQGVPAMYAKLLEHLRALGEPLHAPALRSIYCGGSALSPSLKREIEAAFGMPIHNGYGLTEAAPTLTQVRLGRPRADCSVGEALPGVELRIVDPDGRELPVNEPGELWARGPGIMKGYYRNAAATAATLRPGGWLATGDIARLDVDDALHVEGRLKELIIRSGFNVYPVEVEAVLNSHPEVTQAAVVGRAVEDNEEVVAFVEMVAGARATAADLMAFAAAGLAPYKRPAEVVILKALPATATGKVLKARLAEEARRRATARPVSSPANPGA
jgi:long-chain acyl-CoA synthetase